MATQRELKQIWSAEGEMMQVWRAVLCLFLLAALMQPVAAVESVDDFEPDPAAEANNNGNGRFMVEEANFDQWVFQGSNNAEAGRARIKSQLKMRIDELVRICGLDESQQRKLTLAGQGDIKRFNDQVEVVRKKFLLVKNDQNKFNQIWQEINPLQQKQAAGLFGESSMFAKILKKTLTEEQQSKHRTVENERRRYRYRAAIEVALINQEGTLALRGDQHDALVKLLLEETQPPLVFGQQDGYYINYAMSKLPQAKLKPLFDKRQWAQVQQQMNQGRSLEAHLAQNGVIDGAKVRQAPAGGGIFGFFGGGRAVAVEHVQVMEAEAVQVFAVEAVAIDVLDVPVVQGAAVAEMEDESADALMPENSRRKKKQ